MNFGQSFLDVHRESLAFAVACPFLFAVPVLAEFAQHVVEMQAGMYDGIEGAQAAENDPLRLWFGVAKVVLITVPTYWMVRFLHSRRDTGFARKWEPRAVRLFAAVLALQLLVVLLSLFVFPPNDAMGLGFLGFSVIFPPLIARFMAAAPLGIWISPQASIRTMTRHFVFALAFWIAAILPLLVLHYVLAGIAIAVTGEAGDWAVMAIDSLVTGLLSLVTAAALWVVATRAGPLGGTLEAPRGEA